MYKIYKNSIHEDNDITGAVKGMDPITYKINDDWTFELPEITIKTTISDAIRGDTIIITETADNDRQVAFYVSKIVYDYRSQLYTWTCPHILNKLASYKCREFTSIWSDISPGYSQYNHQTSSGQGQEIWRRQYFSVLYMMKILVRRATGLSVDDINSEDADEKPSGHYYKYQDPVLLNWITVVLNYEDLGVSTPSIHRLGTATHLEHASNDVSVLAKLPNCLDLLRLLCGACRLTINIFRSDYKILPLEMSTLPTDAATLEREDIQIEKYREFSTGVKTLEPQGGEFETAYGYYDNLDLFVPYSYGVPGADREVVAREHTEIDDDVQFIRPLTSVYPAFFRIYSINGANGYQSDINYIYDAYEELYDYHMLARTRQLWWADYNERWRFRTKIPGLYMKTMQVELDLAEQIMTYEYIR